GLDAINVDSVKVLAKCIVIHLLKIIAKYGTPNENWINSQFESVADDVYTIFFERSDPPKDVEDVVKPEVRYVVKTTNLEVDQGSYLSSSDEFDSSDESSSLEKSVSGSLNKSVSQKGPLKDLLKWYDDEKDKDEE
ncbi:hypothetical protein Tco_1147393, partial [Tanacetum coccineum]